MDNRNKTTSNAAAAAAMPHTVFECVIPYIQDARDRASISLVCRRWYQLDSLTRKNVTIAFCYAATPDQLLKRFPFLESIKLKGKPRASMFDLIPKEWGGYASPWVQVIAASFIRVKSLHFRRMIISDADLELLAHTRGKFLEVLKLDRCSGFSTDGLLHVSRSCRNLKTLLLEESEIDENDGQWLHELALNNTILQILNFYLTELTKISPSDLELLAGRCQSLVSVKISDCNILTLVDFFRAATTLEEFCGGSFNGQPGQYNDVIFPQSLRQLALTYMSRQEMPIIFPFAHLLKQLDLLYAFLDTDDHCLLLQRCPNLEALEVRAVIGDRGVEVLATFCKKMKRLRIERGADEQGMEDEGGEVTHRGLIALAQGCVQLEYIAVYVADITNDALACIGRHLKELTDFRIVLLGKNQIVSDLPLDNGVRALLRCCLNLRRFGLYLRPGGLSDVGLSYVGQYGRNLRWILLGYVGDSDAGLLDFSRGCPNLEKLELRGCYCFSEHALAMAVHQLVSLKYLWVQGYNESPTGHDLLAMTRPFWNIELIPPRQISATEHPAQILAYYSLAGPRIDNPYTPSFVPTAYLEDV